MLHLTTLVTSGTNVVLLSLTLNQQLPPTEQAFPWRVWAGEPHKGLLGVKCPPRHCDRKRAPLQDALSCLAAAALWLSEPFPDRKTEMEASI